MKTIIRSEYFLLLLASILLGTGCNRKSESEAVADYRIGVLACLTGPAAQYGEELQNGAKLAASDFETKTGKKVKLIIRDTKSNPKDGLAAFNALADIDKIHFIVGDVLSGVVATIAEPASQKGVLVFAPGASTPSLDGIKDNIYRNWVSDAFDAQVIADYCIKEGFKRVAVAYINNDYGNTLSQAFKTHFLNSNRAVFFHVIPEEGYAGQDVCAKLLDQQPDAIYVIGYAKNLGRLAKQLGELKGQVPQHLLSNLVASEVEAQKLADQFLDGIVFTDPTSSLPAKFIDEYKNLFSAPPSVVAAHSYDAMSILLQTLSLSPNIDVSSVKLALSKIKDYPGISGSTCIDGYGDATKPVYLRTLHYENGTYRIEDIGLFRVSSKPAYE